MGQFKHTHKMLKICLILTTLSSVVFSTQLEDIADVRRGAARDPKLFFVSSSSTTSTISTSTLCYSTINSAATTCPGRKKKRAIMEAIDHDTPVEADKVSSLESGMEEVESANQRQGKFLLYWLTTTSTSTTTTFTATLILSCVPTGFSECG